MHSDLEGPANIGSPEYVSVDELVTAVAAVARKQVNVQYVDGPVGVLSRNFSNDRIYSTGWKSKFSLSDGIAETYPWIEQQVREAAAQTSSAGTE